MNLRRSIEVSLHLLADQGSFVPALYWLQPTFNLITVLGCPLTPLAVTSSHLASSGNLLSSLKANFFFIAEKNKCPSAAYTEAGISSYSFGIPFPAKFS